MLKDLELQFRWQAKEVEGGGLLLALTLTVTATRRVELESTFLFKV